MHVKIIALAAATLTALAQYAEGAGTLYAVTGGTNAGTPVKLVQIDPSTGSTTVVGPLGIATAGVTGLTYDAQSETLYALTGAEDIYTVDVVTGAATQHGHLSGGFTDGLAASPSGSTLYAINYGASDQELVAYDVATKATSTVGSLNLPNPFGQGFASSVEGLTFDRHTGILYGFDVLLDRRLVAINPATGAATTLASDFDYIVSSLASDPDAGTLYGINNYTSQLVRIDTTDGYQASTLGPIDVGEVGAMAFVPSAVPEPSTLLLAALAVGGLLVTRWPRCFHGRRRRGRTPG